MTFPLRTMLLVLCAMFSGAAMAQQDQWVQLEAQPGVSPARDSAAEYARLVEDVAGFRLGSSNWHAVVIGPFDTATAIARRTELRRRGLIPGDAFITDGETFRQQFWPIEGALAAPSAGAAQSTPETAAPLADLRPVDETPAEARRSEGLLSRDEKRDLQTALEWEGFYTAAIDGAFGRGTRAAMSDWQAANGYETTGILTTRQRDVLLAAYNAVLDGIGMQSVRDDVTGIQIDMPLAMVGFDRHEPPFAHYPARDGADSPKVLLISQRGDQNTLYGLYDIMQTLEIVPQRGAREKRGNGFSLTGEGTDFISQTEVVQRDGTIKGFTLIWPRGDEKRRGRVIDAMKGSFLPMPGVVMDDLVGEPGEDQRIDLLAGLEIRRPAISRSGFYVDSRGHVLTTADAVDSCRRITLNEEVEVQVQARDAAGGLALLVPSQPLAPRAFARFQAGVPRLKSEVVLSGYSYEGILGAPSLTFGTLADLRGLNGEETIKRFDLAAQSGDAGGPVLNTGGAVLGMLIPGASQDGRALPEQVAFGVDVDTIVGFLSSNGIVATAAERGGSLKAGVMNDLAKDMTVLVSCWR